MKNVYNNTEHNGYLREHYSIITKLIFYYAPLNILFNIL